MNPICLFKVMAGNLADDGSLVISRELFEAIERRGSDLSRYKLFFVPHREVCRAAFVLALRDCGADMALVMGSQNL